MAGYGLGDWYAKELRLTAFPIDAIGPARMHFWEALTGSAPNEVRNRPPQQMVSEEGPLLNGWLRVEANSNRIDWRLFPPPGLASGELPAVGPYDVPERGFRELMRRWLADCPSLRRLGYGSELLLPADSRRDACRKLDDLLPAVDVEPENTRDFLYRINRRCASSCGLEEMRINRLSTWSVMQIIETSVNISDEGAPRVTRLPNPRDFCRLELDINTIPEFDRELEKSIVPGIFDELVDIGNEIATKGDVS